MMISQLSRLSKVIKFKPLPFVNSSHCKLTHTTTHLTKSSLSFVRHKCSYRGYQIEHTHFQLISKH